MTPEGIELVSKSFMEIVDEEIELMHNQLRAMALSATFSSSKMYNFGYLTRLNLDVLPPFKIEFVERQVGKNSVIATCFYVDTQSRMELEVRKNLRKLCFEFADNFESLPESISDTDKYQSFKSEIELFRNKLMKFSHAFHKRVMKNCIFKEIVYLRKDKEKFSQIYPEEPKDIADFSMGISNIATGETVFESLLKENNIRKKDVLRVKLDWHYYMCPECGTVYQKKQKICDAGNGLCRGTLERHETTAIMLLNETNFLLIYGNSSSKGIKEPLIDVKLRALFSRVKIMNKEKTIDFINKTKKDWKTFGLMKL
ncbi:MAG: hypothetical protein EU549_03380 [Promethearchaeota archaeon]|nr:MAG: hypothetical protein EU549_03380 [Candidatus Lokiarchaeota archaeon]